MESVSWCVFSSSFLRLFNSLFREIRELLFLDSGRAAAHSKVLKKGLKQLSHSEQTNEGSTNQPMCPQTESSHSTVILYSFPGFVILPYKTITTWSGVEWSEVLGHNLRFCKFSNNEEIQGIQSLQEWCEIIVALCKVPATYLG